MAWVMGRVKLIKSADTVTLVSPKSNAEKDFSFAYVTVPRQRREGDEPFAFQAREFTRLNLVGKDVRFQQLYEIPQTKRAYGVLQLEDGSVFPDKGIEAGWFKVRDGAGAKDDSPEVAERISKYRELESKASAEGKGVWDKSSEQIELRNDIGAPEDFLNKWKGKQIDAVVERVVSGDRIAARLLLSPTSHVETIILIAGIKAPATKRILNGNDVPAEEGGDEAKEFVTARLINRNVQLDLVGLSPQNQLVANVKHPLRGSIAPFILSAGLARCVDHHSTMLGSEMATLRKAELQGKNAQVGLFKGHVKKNAGGSLEGVVSRVQSADTIFVRNKAGQEKRISLSSIRGPKQSDPKQAPFVPEGREFLRKKLIGKHVKFSVDGKRPATEGFEEREVATVILKDTNVSLGLVKAGFASVIRHRRDDDDRSPIYDELLAAEEQAQKEKIGMYSDKPPSSKPLIDASENVQMAKRYLSILERKSSIPAVVDFVKGGSRFSIHVPSEGIKLTLVLAGVRAPRSARNANEKGEPFGQEAHDFANRHCMQRDAKISVENIDKVGGFIGSLAIGNDDFARLLIEAGLASVQPNYAERASSGKALRLTEAESAAKSAKRGIWHDYEEDTSSAAPAAAQTSATPTNGSASRKKDYREAVVSHIEETGTLKLQLVGSGTDELVGLSKALQSFYISPANANPLTGPPRVGDVVAAKFELDGQWYRAKVRHVDREAKKAEVLYLDYGNSEKLVWTKLRVLPVAQFGVQKLRPQAVDAVLAGVELPKQADYLQDAVSFLGSVVQDKTLVASVEGTEKDGALVVILFDPAVSTKSEESVNADILSEGLALVSKNAPAEIKAQLLAKQQKAIDERVGMWEYGDLRED